MPLAHIFRPAEPSDLGFILKPWLGEMRLSPACQFIDSDVFYPAQRRVIQECIARSMTLVACNPEDPSHCYGFICFEPSAVHWVYVKSTFRLMGVGASLFRHARSRMNPGEPVKCSHASGLMGLRKLREKYRLSYDPYILRPS